MKSKKAIYFIIAAALILLCIVGTSLFLLPYRDYNKVYDGIWWQNESNTLLEKGTITLKGKTSMLRGFSGEMIVSFGEREPVVFNECIIVNNSDVSLFNSKKYTFNAIYVIKTEEQVESSDSPKKTLDAAGRLSAADISWDSIAVTFFEAEDKDGASEDWRSGEEIYFTSPAYSRNEGVELVNKIAGNTVAR